MILDFNNMRVLLVGDFMIDKYIFGESVRMSPEGPFPVLNPKKSYSTLGGAGNVALNLRTLGASVTCVGYVGSDNDGAELVNLLQRQQIDTKYIHTINSQTTVKERFYSNGKQVLRVDKEDIINNWSPSSISELQSNKYDLVIFSDYNKGVLNNSWFSEIESENIFVDPKKNDFSFYSNAKIITPNLNELQRAVGQEISNHKSLVYFCEQIVNDLNLEYIIAKQGDKGMTVVGKDGFFENFVAHKVNNVDVTGAGDTVISVFSLVYTKTKNVIESVRIANAAAAIVVGKEGTASVTIDEINGYI